MVDDCGLIVPELCGMLPLSAWSPADCPRSAINGQRSAMCVALTCRLTADRLSATWNVTVTRSIPAARFGADCGSPSRSLPHGVGSSVPLGKRLPDDPVDGPAVLRQQFQPAPNALAGEIDTAEEESRR